MGVFVLVASVSLLLQILAAFLAIRLIPVSRGFVAWIFIAAAVLLMAFRRTIPLFRVIFEHTNPPVDPFGELVALVISVFLVIGMFLVKRLFVSLRQAESNLAGEKERLSITLGSIGDGVIVTDTAGKVILINKVGEALTGWSQEEAFGSPLTEVFRIAEEKTSRPLDVLVAQSPATEDFAALPASSVLLTKGGKTLFTANSASPVRDRDGAVRGLVVVFRDVTEKRKVEEELQKREKLESLSLLAGGIAHDFNNLLTGILGNISLARCRSDPAGKPYAWLKEAEKASVRAKGLTQQLLTFSRGGAPVTRPEWLDSLVAETASFAVHGSRTVLSLHQPRGLWPVLMDKAQITQVVHNLVINAVQAMPGGGTLTVRERNAFLEKCNPQSLPEGRYVQISFQDQGVGIPGNVLGKIFDPFFTTKPEGSGLGLSVTHSIVRQHSGHIAVESEPGKGSTFTVWLPAASEEPQGPAAETPPQGRRTGRILVMDDEDSVRTLAGAILGQLGYRAAYARNGDEACSLYRQAREEGDPFDAVILDLTVPGGMGGKETVSRLRGLDASVCAVVSSGYSNDFALANHKSLGFAAILPKPYGLEDLRKVMEAIGRRPPRDQEAS